MTDYLNPHKIYPDDISRRIDVPPGFDSVRPTVKESLTTVCAYCNGQEKPLYVDINKSKVTISDKCLRIGIMSEFAEMILIRYCPMCGRKLEVEG